MTSTQALKQGTRVRDAIGARVYGTDERGTVDRMSGDTHAWIKWDGYDVADDLVAIEDLEIINVMTTQDARALAAQYQSPGAIGRTFAAFASGRRVSYERFMSECQMTSSELGFEAYDDMRALEAYAGDTSDDVWTDTDTGAW